MRLPALFLVSLILAIPSHGAENVPWERLRVPADWKGENLTLELGQIDDCGETFFNGSKIGASGSIEPFRTASGDARSYTIPADQIRAEDWNLLAIRVWDGGGAGGVSSGPLKLGSRSSPTSRVGRGCVCFVPVTRIVAQFLYCAAQVGIFSFFINYLKDPRCMPALPAWAAALLPTTMKYLRGDVMPMLMGWLADDYSMRVGFLIPLVCFVGIMACGFGWRKLYRHDLEPA